MASYKIVIEARAEKELRKLPPAARTRIAASIDKLSGNSRPAASRKMVGSEYYRLRVGDYRIIYAIEDDLLMIFIIELGHRREIYR